MGQFHCWILHYWWSELHVSDVTLYGVMFWHYNFPMAIFHNIYKNVPVKNIQLSSSPLGICFFTCLIENKLLDIRLITWAIWYFQLRSSSMKMLKNFIDFSLKSFPILFNILLLIATFSPVKLHCCWWAGITIYLVFVAFRDNLFGQNQWNYLLTVSFASRNNTCKLKLNKHSVVSSANNNILPLHEFGVSFT